MISKLLHGLLDEAKSSMTTTKSSSGGDGRSSCSRSNAVHQQESLFGLLPSSSSSMLLKSPYKATIFPATKSNDNYYNIDKSNNNNNNNTGSMVVLLACSSSSSTQKNQARLLGTNDLPTTMSDNDNSNNNKMGYYGPLGQYRKGFLDHLKPKAVFISTIRVAIQQGTIIAAGFMTDQVDQDLKRRRLVDEGKITVRESEEQADEWERIEWERRWKMFPNKFLTAYAKYHATTLVLRLYEWVCAQLVTDKRMDMLTMDTFAASRTLAKKMDVRDRPLSVTQKMTHTAFWANILFILSDYTVHQALLCYAYYVYYDRKQRRRRRLLEEGGKGGGSGGPPSNNDDSDDYRTMIISFARGSGQLFVSRVFGLLCCAVGAGVGTVIRPGWGTLMLSSMGEGAAATVVDDGTAAAMAALNK